MKTTSSASWVTWCLLLCKRQCKTVGFWIVMILVPLLTTVFLLCASQDSGFVRVAVAARSPEDIQSKVVLDRLREDRELLLITVCDSETAALDLLTRQEVDTVWILRENLSEAVTRYANGEKEPLAFVYATADSAFVHAAEDVLFSALYPSLSYALYEGYAADTLGETDEAVLQETYDTVFRDETLFVYRDAAGGQTHSESYVTAPLRGLLMTVLLLCALSATLYHLRDEREGRFWRLSATARLGVCLVGNVFVASVAAVCVTVALVLAGQYTSFVTETAIMAVSVLASAGFAALCGALCRKESALAMAIPLLLLVTLVCCPIFFHSESFTVIGKLCVPYYALYAVREPQYIVYLFFYSAVVYALSLIIQKIRSGGVR